MKKVLIITASLLLAAALIFAAVSIFRPKEEPLVPQSNIICIDAGHGGHDAGAVLEERYEKDDNLRLALKVAEYVEELGYTVVLTRSDDTFVELRDRCDIANDAGAAFFVSLHRNSAESAGAKGVEVWASAEAPAFDVKLSSAILNGLKDVGISSDRGVKYGTQGSRTGEYTVNKYTKMPSCIVETGFITSSDDNTLFDDNLDAYARAIADAIDSLYQD